MKKAIFLFVVIIYSFSATAQRIALNEGVSIEFPNGIQKITKEYALQHAEKKFPKNKMALYAYHDMHSPYMYKVDDIILTLFVFDTTYSFEKDKLINTKKGLDELNHSDKSYSSYIRKGKGNSAIVINYKINDAEYYGFYCYNDNNTRAINGTIEFKADEENEAANILNNLLASIKFKD